MAMRKFSISRKGSSGDVRKSAALGDSVRKDRPPSSWSASGHQSPGNTTPVSGTTTPPSASATTDEGSSRRRKPSLAVKSKRRLSAIFNPSQNVSRSDRASASPAPEGVEVLADGPAPVVDSPAASGSAPSSISSVPATDATAKYSNLETRGLPPLPTETAATPGSVAPSTTATSAPPTSVSASTPSTDALSTSVASLKVNGTHAPSPLSQSTNMSAPPALPVTPSKLGVPAVGGLSASPASTPGVSGASTPTRIQNLYSQWGLNDSDSEDDEDGYLTPSEGLSEVEEGDEPEEEGAPQPKPFAKTFANVNGNGSAVPSKAGASSIASSGASAITAVGGTNGTGPKVTRSKASGAKVHKSEFKRGNPLEIDQGAALAPDLDLCREVLALFLTSKMKESEEMLVKADPLNQHMYLQSGHSVIQALKGLMTFGSDDLASALEIAKATTATATVLRKPTESVLAKLRPGASQQRVRHMSVLERHAELVYAETLLVKAIIGIVGGGDWMGLIREAFNMRTAHGIYRTLQVFLEESDKDGFDEDIDMDFRSGVLLGTGTSSLMLSLLPSKVLKVAEVFGYAGDRHMALKTLMSAGGWSDDSDVPAYNETNEGVRRPICDMILLTFHLVISVLMPVSGIDVAAARKILNYNMRRYPNGIFFLYFQARLHSNEGEPELANKSLQKALDLDLEYVQLQHMCLWDFGCNYFQLNDWNGSRQCFDILRRESNWSRAVYTYATAVNVMELVRAGANPAEIPEATEANCIALIESLPKLTKKIAGKSLPIEKLASRKGRKYLAQGNVLFLPAMELAYVFGSLGHTPRRVLISKWLPHINAELERLESSTPEEWGTGDQYWDDYVLGHFLRACVQFVAAYPPAAATESARAAAADPEGNAALDAAAEADFNAVIEASPRVKLDHYILFHSHYEFGRLYARRGDAVNAQAQFDVVMNNKLPVPNHHIGKGKYSLEGALQIKTHAAMSALREQQMKK